MRIKSKFNPGDRVKRKGDDAVREIDRAHYDGSDGWEYHLVGDRECLFTFESDLVAIERTVVLVTTAQWDAGRHLFSEEEKGRLREAIIGESVCPLGAFIDLAKLDDRLRAKIEQRPRR